MIERNKNTIKKNIILSTEKTKQLIVNDWVIHNVKLHPNSNYKISFNDIYEKFKKETNIKITKNSFGIYFHFALTTQFNKTPITTSTTGSGNYFGLDITGLTGDYQYFDLLDKKGVLLEFNYFTDKKILDWFNNCVVLSNSLENTDLDFIRTHDLCQNYIYYYNIKTNVEPGILRNFGVLLKRTIKKHNLPIFYNKQFKQVAGYNGIKGLLVKKYTDNKNLKSESNKTTISKFNYAILLISIINFMLFSFIIFNNYLGIIPFNLGNINTDLLQKTNIGLQQCLTQNTTTQLILENCIKFFYK